MSDSPPRCCHVPLAAGPVQLDAAQSHHLVRVLRLRDGDAVELFDGAGAVALGTITRADPRAAVVRLGAVRRVPRAAPVDLTLGVALCKPKAFDLIVQKASELDAARLVPLVTRYSQPEPARPDAQLARWHRLAAEAARQCRRDYLLDVAPAGPLESFLAGRSAGELRLVLAPSAHERPIGAVLRAAADATQVACLVGPEGGLTDQEMKQALDAGFAPASLGSTILRVETAALAAAAIVMNHLA